MINSHVETKTSKVTLIDSIICDICHKEFKGSNWVDDPYYQIDTKISYEDYTAYPDDYCVNEKMKIHICPDCFKNRLLPWIESHGSKIVIESDY